MANFKADILEDAAGEPIVAIVVAEMDRDTHSDERVIAPIDHNKVLAWSTVANALDYEYDPGYGGEDCHAITAWTPTRVIFCGCYDGSTWLQSVPRNPTDHTPKFCG